MRQTHPDPKTQALAFLEELPWGDIDQQIFDMELALQLAIEATAAEFQYWENTLRPAIESDGYDEFSLPPDRTTDLNDHERLAYVARLLRSLALAYGIKSTLCASRSQRLVNDAKAHSPAGVLRGLNVISWLPR